MSGFFLYCGEQRYNKTDRWEIWEFCSAGES